MPTHSDWLDISKQIEQAIQLPFAATEIQTVSGGCINSTYQITGNGRKYFIKLNHVHLLDMFKAEFSGLAEIALTNTIKVPQPILTGTVADQAFLVLEYIGLTATNHRSDSQLGQQLASLHKIPQAFFGWHKDNTIGSTAQINTPDKDWLAFWQSNRLNFQLSLAKKMGQTVSSSRLGKNYLIAYLISLITTRLNRPCYMVIYGLAMQQ